MSVLLYKSVQAVLKQPQDSSYYYICVIILLFVSSYYYMCPHTPIYVSSYSYICVLILLYLLCRRCSSSLRTLRFSFSLYTCCFAVRAFALRAPTPPPL